MDNYIPFKSDICDGEIKINGKNDILVKGRIHDSVKDKRVFYIAAAPADYRSSFTGSGLPFANQVQAFDSTPNVGMVELDDKKFEIGLMLPNSYIVGLGSVTIPPTLYIEYLNGENRVRQITIKLSNGIPYRSLTYPMTPRARTSATFYDSQFYLPVRSQEQILLDSGYPSINAMPKNHWGLKPPL